MADLDSSKMDNKIEALKGILLQIMYNTANQGSGDQSSKNYMDPMEIQSHAVLISYLPLIYETMGMVSHEMGQLSQHTRAIKDDSIQIVALMNNLCDKQDLVQDSQEKQFDDLINNTEAFVDYTEKDNEKQGILSNLMGTVKGAVSGFISGLFAPKPKTVILAKSTIKELAGIAKAFTGKDGKQSFKEKVKDKAAGSVADAVSGAITKIGDAITSAIKGIATALKIFIYVIFPLVILGAVVILVIGLYFIVKLILEFLGDVIGTVLLTIAECLKNLVDAVVGVIDAIAGIIDAIADVITGIFGAIGDVLTAPITLMTEAIDTIGNLLAIPLNAIADAIRLIAEAIGPALGELISSIATVIEVNAEKFGLILEGIGRGINLFVDILESVWNVIKAIADAVLSFLSPDNLAGKAIGAVGSAVSSIGGAIGDFFFGSDDDEEEDDKSPFTYMTDTICEAINDFQSMVRNYLKMLALNAMTQTIRTNIMGASNINTFGNTQTGNTAVNYNYPGINNMNDNTNNTNNTSTVADGKPNVAFNNSTLSRYDYEYDSNTMNGNSNNEEVIREIKETNKLLNKLIASLTGSPMNRDSAPLSSVED